MHLIVIKLPIQALCLLCLLAPPFLAPALPSRVAALVDSEVHAGVLRHDLFVGAGPGAGANDIGASPRVWNVIAVCMLGPRNVFCFGLASEGRDAVDWAIH